MAKLGRRGTRRDVLAMSTQVLLGCAFGVLGCLAVYKAWLPLTGTSPDDRLPLLVVLLLDLALCVGLAAGVVGGVLVWVVAMRPFLRREEMERSLNFGVRWTRLRHWNAKLLDRAYRWTEHTGR